jgi:putative phosphoserine phosphatase / 1-acylglycerol-3-phosphate O-acyltransferase
VWPRSEMLPNVLGVLNPPTIRVRVGNAVKLVGEDLDDDTRKIMKAIRRLLPEEAREKRVPSAEELRRTYPRNYKGDPAQEAERRPGTD